MTTQLRGPARGAILLFLVAIFTAIALVFAGTWYAVLRADQANRQWCTLLGTLTAQPLPANASPATRQFRGELTALEHRFGC